MVHADAEDAEVRSGHLSAADADRAAFNALLNKFKIGMVVALNSGGPLMTVCSVVRWMKPPKVSFFGAQRGPRIAPGIGCEWIDETGVPRHAKYYPEMLRVRKPE